MIRYLLAIDYLMKMFYVAESKGKIILGAGSLEKKSRRVLLVVHFYERKNRLKDDSNYFYAILTNDGD